MPTLLENHHHNKLPINQTNIQNMHPTKNIQTNKQKLPEMLLLHISKPKYIQTYCKTGPHIMILKPPHPHIIDFDHKEIQHKCSACNKDTDYSDNICPSCWTILISIVNSHLCQSIPKLKCDMDINKKYINKQYKCQTCMLTNISTFIKLIKILKIQ